MLQLFTKPLYSTYAKALRKRLKGAKLPHHVGMIIDGNRRWAKLGGFTPVHGHRAGAAKLLEFLKWCDSLGVRVVTLYLLSNDNLSNRTGKELSDLQQVIADLADSVASEGTWKVQRVGNAESTDSNLNQRLADAQNQTAGNTGMHINMAVGYGGRHEIVDAVRAVLSEAAAGGKTLEELSRNFEPELLSEKLYTSGQPDPDLIIRTSGEQRLSDFMLWQSAHSEFYFMEALGPAMREIDFLRAVRDYSRRQRRYGA
ncbi:MAG: isoprenyl transferase [Microbacteriaceae bacterium]|nr:isoprenyl transferase [Microbacteriaceae bacterium]